jgi:hypothetical protein
MGVLSEIVRDVETFLLENPKEVVEVNVLSEERANSLFNGLSKYDVRRAVVISGADRSVSYTLHISNK